MDKASFSTWGSLLVFETLTLPHVTGILLRMLCAFMLGAVIAYRPWRRLRGGRLNRVPAETAQAQTIIAVAGALMIVVIGDSLARAFGLVGLGTFIRFRTAIKDPRDVAIMLITIAVGMACGLGAIPTAVVGTLFVVVILALFDRYGHPQMRCLRVTIGARNPRILPEAIRSAFPRARAVRLPKEGGGSGKVSFMIEASEHEDAFSIRKTLEVTGVEGIEEVRVDAE
jgi:uncharacterized membrane protein YhiD involved in acid resistance